ncbi:MAG: phasin family protein [Betaproteobacteria bacterium]
MTPISQDLNAVAKNQLESVIRAATVAAQGAERFTELQVRTVKAGFEDGVKQVKAVAAVKEPSELQALSAKMFQPNVDKATAYAREVYETFSATQAELGKLLEAQVADLNKQAVVALDTMIKSAPAGSEMAVAAFKQALGTANQAYESFAKSFQGFGTLVENSVAPTSRKKAA